MVQNNEQLLLPDELSRLPDSPADIARVLGEHHAADAVEAINSLDADTAARVVEQLPLDTAVQVFSQSHLERADKLIDSVGPDRAADIVCGISADRRADIFRKLPFASHAKCLAKLDPAARKAVEQLMAYPPHTAGGIMTTEFLSVPGSWTVAQALEQVHKVGDEKETVYTIFVTDPQTKALAHVVSLRQLIMSDPKTILMSITSNRPLIAVAPETDREEVDQSNR